MAGVDFSSRQSASLPSINSLNIEKRDASDFEPRLPNANMASPSYGSAYAGPSQPFSHPPPVGPSLTASLSGLISPPESRRMSGDEKEQRQPPQPPRQSLPSIHEALGQEQSYLQPTTQPPVSQPPYQPQQQQPPPPPQPHQSQHSSPAESTRRTYPTDYPSQASPASSFPPTATTRSPYMNPPTTTAAPPPIQSAPPEPLRIPPSYPSNHNSKLPSLHLRTEQPPAHSSISQMSYSAHPPAASPAYEPGPQPQSAGPMSAPYGGSNGAGGDGRGGSYNQTPQPNYPFSAPPQATPGAGYPPSATFPPRFPGSWRQDGAELSRVEETKRNGRVVGPGYGESIKRHLDHFDLEASLNEIAESSGRTLDFARHYGQRAHQTLRSGPMPGSMPSLPEVDEQLKQQQRLHDALVQLREVVQTQQVAEQVKDPRFIKGMNGYDEDQNGYVTNDPIKQGHMNGPDPKKRRGRAAPPGRCHSCNRAETPEWRRGPDGARTLCNACGLHYAKLTRKMGTNKAAIGSSNLRPKSMGPGSPAA